MANNEELTLTEEGWDFDRRDDGRILLSSPYEIVSGENLCLFLTVTNEEFYLTDDNHVALTFSQHGWDISEEIVDELNSLPFECTRLTNSGEIISSSQDKSYLLIALNEARVLASLIKIKSFFKTAFSF